MNVIEIVCGVLLLVACLVLIVLVMMQEGKQGMSQSLGGGSSDSYLDKNRWDAYDKQKKISISKDSEKEEYMHNPAREEDPPAERSSKEV